MGGSLMRHAIKPVEGFPEYQVANSGYVIGVKGQVLPGSDNGTGYIQVALHGGTAAMKYVHRLVAEAFIANPENLPEINHIDEDKGNNNVVNLEWITRPGNMEHSLAKNYLLTSPHGVEVEVFNLNKFCRDNDIKASHMYEVVKGLRGQHKGWKGRVL